MSVIPQGVAETKAQEYLEELEFLVQTAGGVTKGIFTQKLAYPDRATFVGSGKLEEIQALSSPKKLTWSCLMMN